MKRVLDVGNCVPDHAAIRELVQQHFDAEVDQAHQSADALEALNRRDYDLVLVNRKLDCDYSEGTEVIRKMKAAGAEVPVMLVTNYSEHQDAAVELGAVPGFGKLALQAPETLELLRGYLA